jgi:hypothetical protein
MIRKLMTKTMMVTVLGALALAPAAFATAGADSNGYVAVAAALTCSSATCVDGDHATAGEEVTLMGMVSNLTQRTRTGTVTVTLTAPSGNIVRSRTFDVTLGAGKSAARSETVIVQSTYPTGDYTLTVSVAGVSASGVITVY